MKYFGKISEITNLQAAFHHVRSNRGGPGIDHVTIEKFEEHLSDYLVQIQQQLTNGTYTFQPVLIVESRKLKRNLSILTVRDRVVHQAISQVISPEVEEHLHPANYSYRFGKSAIKACSSLEKELADGEYPHVLRADILQFFDSISHEVLRQLLVQVLPQESRTVDLILQAITPREIHFGQIQIKSRGVPQGAPLSPLLANIYLAPFDFFIEKLIFKHYRFCDDFVLLLKNKDQFETLLVLIQNFLQEYLQLQLHQDKTYLADLSVGFDFLGFHFSSEGRKVSTKAQKKLQENVATEACANKKKQLIQGWNNYYAQQEKPTMYTFVDTFANLFKGTDYFAVASQSEQQQGYAYAPVKRKLTHDDIVQHLLGSATLAIYLVKNNNVFCSCLDIDIEKNILQQYSHSGEFAIYADRALSLIRKIQTILTDIGISSLVEESGYKGYHLWLFFAKATPAHEVVRFWNKILDVVRIPKGIKVEIFPRESKDSEIHSLVKLPLGLHPKTKNRTMFLDEEGEYIANPHSLLASYPKIKAKHFMSVMDKIAAVDSTAVNTLINNCCVVKYLCEKAKKEKDLGHFERMILLYTLGQLGPEGQEYLHKVIGYCSNYDYYYTQKQIERKHPAPMSCRTIHEIMGREMCNKEYCCNFQIPEGGYPSPILHVYPDATKNLARKIKKGETH